MSKKIDQRASLHGSDAAVARHVEAQPAARGEAALKLEGRAAKAGAEQHKHAPVKTTVGEEAAQAAADSDVRSTFEMPGRDWGLGFGNLGAVQDSETAFVIMGDGSINVVESNAGGYMLRTGFPIDGYFAGHLFEDAGLHTGTNAELLHNFSDRKTIVLQAGQTNFSVQGDIADVFGTAAGESISASGGDDIVHGGGGNDNIIGANGQDILWGGAGNDAVAGNEGNDFVGGNVGNDTVDGGGGDDFLTGGGGTDSLLGGDGNDIIMGGDANDSADGGAGADTLVGGAGADSLTGGDGIDVFVFTQGDSGAAVNQLDIVADFEIDVDQIDLTGFDKAIDFVDAFSHVAFQATITKVVPGDDAPDDAPVQWSVKIDTNGDGTADQEITVTIDKDGAQGDLTTDSFIV